MDKHVLIFPAVSREPLLFAHKKYGSRQRVRPKIRHLMCVWRMSLRRTKGAIILWAGSLIIIIWYSYARLSVAGHDSIVYTTRRIWKSVCTLRLLMVMHCDSELRCICAALWQNQQNDWAPSEDSDQPGHPPSLVRVFTVRMKKDWILSYPLSGQRRLWSDWADAQADLSLRWAHSHFVGFVMRGLILQ